jgi:hypothetical protein
MRREREIRLISSDMRSACSVRRSTMCWTMSKARVNGILVRQNSLTYTLIVHIVLLFHLFIDLGPTSCVPDNVYVTQARRNPISTATSGPITMKTVTGRLTRKICARCIRRDIAGVVAISLVRRRGASWGCMCLIWGRGGRVVREF